MKARTMSLLLSLGCAALTSGWCLERRVAGGLAGRLPSRHAFWGGTAACGGDLWPGGSSGGFSAAPLASSVGCVPGDPAAGPAAADTSVGFGMTTWGGFAGWGAAAGGSSEG